MFYEECKAEGMSATILLLEDDAVLRDLLCEVLEDEGYRVIHADTLIQLLAIVPPRADLLITDLLIDQREVGIQAIEQIRRATSPHLPALICSAAQQQIEALQGEIARLGARVLDKPFLVDDLLGVVAEAVRRSPAARTQPTAPLQIAFA
jgi:two-component system, NtrC family, nitrogen regulation response regulator GlnG